MRHIEPIRTSVDARLDMASSASEAPIVVPGGDFLLTADFARDGVDLVLTGSHGERVVIAGYFSTGHPPILSTAAGAQLAPDMVKSLAIEGTTFAQAAAPGLGAAIGQVKAVGGTASVTHSDGTTSALQVGDPVYRSDVVRTEGGSSIGVTFNDGTNFSLGAGARMVLNEMIYNPGSRGNISVSMLQGSFVFLTGQVSKEGGTMEVRTPVATIGIRGTTVAGNLDLDGSNGQFSLLPDPDGRVGVVDIINNGGTVTLTQALQTTQVLGFSNPPGAPLLLPQTSILQIYGLALDSHGSLIGQPPLQNLQQDPERRGDLNMNQIGHELAQINPAAGEQHATDGSLTPMAVQNNPLTVTTLDLGLPAVQQVGNDVVVVTPGPTSTQVVVAQNAVVSHVFVAPPGGGVVVGTDGDDTLVGGPGDDTLIGGAGDDVLIGGGGNNLLEGDQGNDTVLGGTGNDTIIGGHGEGNDIYDGGGGNNTVTYTSATLPIQVDLAAGTASGDPAIGVDTLTNIQNVTGGSGSDVLAGNDQANILRGGPGNDLLIGRGGDDLLDGGAGNDTAMYAASIANYAITLNGDGSATVRSLLSSGVGAEGIDHLVGVESLHFADDTIVIDGSNQAPTLGGVPAGTVATLSGLHPLDLPPDGVAIDPGEVNGVDLSVVTLHQNSVVTVTFQAESAGFQNTLGWYTVAPDGTFGEAHLVFPNASAIGSGGALQPDQSSVTLGTIPAGTAIGFFVIANGFGLNPLFGSPDALASGHLNFMLDGEGVSLANATGTPSLVFTAADGSQQTIIGSIFHSTASANGLFGDTLALNPDGLQHFASGTFNGSMGMAIEDTLSLGVGVEDLPQGGDQDFNDLVFTVSAQPGLPLNNQGIVVLAPNLSVGDPDGQLLSAASVHLTQAVNADDSLGFAGGWTLSGSNHLLRPGGTDTGLTANVSGDTVTLTGFATHATYQDALRAVALIDGGVATAGERTATIQVFDELGRASGAAETHVTLEAPTPVQGASFTVATDVISSPPVVDQPHTL